MAHYDYTTAEIKAPWNGNLVVEPGEDVVHVYKRDFLIKGGQLRVRGRPGSLLGCWWL